MLNIQECVLLTRGHIAVLWPPFIFLFFYFTLVVHEGKWWSVLLEEQKLEVLNIVWIGMCECVPCLSANSLLVYPTFFGV